MDAQTCLKKLGYVGVLSFATVDADGNPQVRNISAIHYEPDAIYFFTARGRDFCKELLDTEKVQVLGYTMYQEMIRLTGAVKPAHADEQEKWKDVIFTEQPYLANVYPGDTRNIGIVFCIRDMEIEYFKLCDRKCRNQTKGLLYHGCLYQLRKMRPCLSAECNTKRKTEHNPSGTLPALRQLL